MYELDNEVFDRALLCVSLCEACIGHKKSGSKLNGSEFGVKFRLMDNSKFVLVRSYLSLFCFLDPVAKARPLLLTQNFAAGTNLISLPLLPALAMPAKGGRKEDVKKTRPVRATRASVEDGTAAAPAVFDKGWGHLKVCASIFVVALMLLLLRVGSNNAMPSLH